MSPQIDPRLLARAFETALPAHKGALVIEHNPHRDVGESVEEHYDSRHFISPVEFQKCKSLDDVWTMRWSTGPLQYQVVVAATLDAIVAALVNRGLAYAG